MFLDDEHIQSIKNSLLSKHNLSRGSEKEFLIKNIEQFNNFFPTSSSPMTIDQQPSKRQSIITNNTLEIPKSIELGEKALKILKMAQAGLNVPPFFIIVGNGNEELEMTGELKTLFGALNKPVIARSAHLDEGKKYPFSGIFDSEKSITHLEKTLFEKKPSSEWTDEERRNHMYGNADPPSLEVAYEKIVYSAYSDEVENYLKNKNITDYNEYGMNVVVMEQVDMNFFAMFMTSTQENPNEMLIIYQSINKSPIKKRDDFTDPDDYRKYIKNRNVSNSILFNKKTHKLEDNNLDESTQSALITLGETAAQIENMFGFQQVELGYAQNKAFVFQSRDFNLTDPNDVPRFLKYKTIRPKHKGYSDPTAFGYGDYHLPVLVIDGVEDDWTDEAFNKDDARELIRNELLEFHKKNPEYILIVKDADVLFKKFSIDYSFLNLLTSKASVILQGRQQSAIRHEDWARVEMQGIRIWDSEGDSLSEFFVHKMKDNAVRTISEKQEGNITIQKISHIRTGDYLHVLSNVDGLFIWSDEAVSSPINSSSMKSNKTPLGGIDFNPESLDLQIKRDGRGVALPVFKQPIDQINIDGFIPVIINITPINVPIFLGLIDHSSKDVTYQLPPDPMDKRNLTISV